MTEAVGGPEKSNSFKIFEKKFNCLNICHGKIKVFKETCISGTESAFGRLADEDGLQGDDGAEIAISCNGSE